MKPVLFTARCIGSRLLQRGDMGGQTFRKRVLNARATHVVLSFLMSLLMRLIYLSCRKERRYASSALPYLQGEQPAIFCFWHGRMIMQPFCKPTGRTMSVLISKHNDGALITATILWFGIGSVRGSKKLGGAQALRDLLQVTERGGNIAITPDGPRGPFQQAAPGAAFVAANTSYPLLPITFSATRYWRFRSWDKFMMPKPFSRLLFIADEVQHVAATDESSLAQASSTLQQALVQITRDADAACGVPQ